MSRSLTRMKVCGLTRPEDVHAAVSAGVDAVGVILAPGHVRSLTLDRAEEVLAGVPEGVTRVGVFVDQPIEFVAEAVRRLELNEVQLHGAEDPDYCTAVPGSVTKTFRVGPGFDPSELEAYRGAVAAVLLDTMVPGAYGGTGTAFDHSLVAGLPDIAPVYLAGGLTPDNVAEAVRTVRPAGVDVSSGVEAAPGIKDAAKMEAMVAAVRAAWDTSKENE